ncbi:MAG: hypothetical protein DMF84_11560 [Acidobacteria bacterium]|nr:MAG: hypothetical protein DMF84_11560 [Acidobacteriota bacterium]
MQTARTIADKARDLAEILKKTEPQFWETRERGYLEFNWTPEARAAASSLADLTSWPPAVYAHKVLMDLAAAAERWHDLAQRDSRKRGRPSGRRRIHLASWVAIHMLHAEVPITKSKEGTFARVLSLVEYYSGMPEADVQRSVRYAFDNDGVKELLQNTAARFPRPKRRRVTAAKLPSTKRRIT